MLLLASLFSSLLCPHPHLLVSFYLPSYSSPVLAPLTYALSVHFQLSEKIREDLCKASWKDSCTPLLQAATAIEGGLDDELDKGDASNRESAEEWMEEAAAAGSELDRLALCLLMKGTAFILFPLLPPSYFFLPREVAKVPFRGAREPLGIDPGTFKICQGA
jgi:hypothetical protein